MRLLVEDKIIALPWPPMDDDAFFNFCMANRDLIIEQDRYGDIHILPWSCFNIGLLESEVLGELAQWNKDTQSGYVLSPTVGFTLPNGAVRSPDASWVSKLRMDKLPASKREKFAHICPDFVVELKYETANLPALQNKMQEYMKNECSLGFLIDPFGQKAFIYRQGKAPELVTDFAQSLDGGTVMPGFLLDLKEFRL